MTVNTMSTLLFDTHAFVKNLTSAGFTERQAEVLANEQVNMIENKLATKQDFHLLDKKIDRLEQHVKRDIKESEMRMTIKLGALMVIALSVLTTIFTTMFKFMH